MQVTIETLIHGGAGLARTPHGVVFVPGAAPGDTIDIAITGKKSGGPTGMIHRIISPSPGRRQPFCPHYGTCGGCDWQHLTLSVQQDAKRTIFRDCLNRIGRIGELPEIRLFSSPETGYRRRVQFKLDIPSAAAGFFARGTNDIVSLDSCPLCTDPVNSLLSQLPDACSRLEPDTRTLRCIAGDQDSLATAPVLPGITGKQVTITVAGRPMIVRGSDFFQGNEPVTPALGAWARPFLSGDLLVDMYGGTGFFGIQLADRFRRVHLVESSSAMVTQARANFTLNNLDSCTAEAIPAERYIHTASTAGVHPGCILVDPPRPGLTRAVREGIAALGPDTILYISCNPATQARDIGYFVNRCGYRLEQAALFDCYPQTHHIETGCILQK